MYIYVCFIMIIIIVMTAVLGLVCRPFILSGGMYPGVPPVGFTFFVILVIIVVMMFICLFHEADRTNAKYNLD